MIKIRHLVIEKSSQWAIGRNITRKCKIKHSNGNELHVPTEDGHVLTINLLHHKMHTYVPATVFYKPSEAAQKQKSLFCAMARVESNINRPWDEIKHIIDRVHKHVCGHSCYSDMKTLLQRNDIWDESIQKYLQQTLERCPACKKTSEAQPERKVSLGTISRSFNEVLCVDHLFLNNICVFHAMDTATRYSVGCAVPNTGMIPAISSLDSHWITPFWSPQTVIFDKAFDNKCFISKV